MARKAKAPRGQTSDQRQVLARAKPMTEAIQAINEASDALADATRALEDLAEWWKDCPAPEDPEDVHRLEGWKDRVEAATARTVESVDTLEALALGERVTSLERTEEAAYRVVEEALEGKDARDLRDALEDLREALSAGDRRVCTRPLGLVV